MVINEHKKKGVTWVDVVDPARGDFSELAQRFELHTTSVQDCMEPEHLPKFEDLGHYSFVILRAMDPNADKRSDSVQELTNKIAIFYSEKYIITFHRIRQPYIDEAFRRWRDTAQMDHDCTHSIVAEILQQVARTYDSAVDDVLKKFESFETEVFSQQKNFKLQSVYLLKRRASVIRRMLKMMEEPIHKIMKDSRDQVKPLYQTVEEHFHKLTFQLEEVRESLISLLSLQVSLVSQRTNEASHKANEVMRVLTIVSTIIMPLNFVASIYGMNFKYMPELESQFGYPIVLCTMAVLASSTLFWFRWKGWLKTFGS